MPPVSSKHQKVDPLAQWVDTLAFEFVKIKALLYNLQYVPKPQPQVLSLAVEVPGKDILSSRVSQTPEMSMSGGISHSLATDHSSLRAVKMALVHLGLDAVLSTVRVQSVFKAALPLYCRYCSAVQPLSLRSCRDAGRMLIPHAGCIQPQSGLHANH